jgi:hypothetical protein
LLVALVYTPFLHEVFNTAPLALEHWLYVFAWTPVIFLLDELRKAILRRRDKEAGAMAPQGGEG